MDGHTTGDRGYHDWQQYLSLANVMLVILDSQGTVAYVNQKSCRILEYSSDELVGKNWFDMCIPSRMREEMQGVFRTLTAGKLEKVSVYENPVVTRSGKEMVIFWHNTVLRDADGAIMATLGAGEESAGRTCIASELLKNISDCRHFAELIHEGVWMVNQQAVTTYINAVMADMVGRAASDVIGKSLFEYTRQADAAGIGADLEKCAQGVSGERRVSFIGHEGKQVCARVSYEPMFDAAGVYAGALMLAVDMTQQCEMEAALHKSEEGYRTLVETVPDIIYEVDLEGKFTFLNEAVEQLGYQPEELLGKDFRDIVHPQDYAEISRNLVLPRYAGKKTGDAGSPKLFDERRTGSRMTKNLRVRLLKKNSDSFNEDYAYFELHSWGIWDREVTQSPKQFMGSRGVARDITERRQAQEFLEYRLEFEKVITMLSTYFINLAIGEIDTAMYSALQAIGEFARADRAYIMVFNYDAGLKIRSLYEWCASDVPACAEALQQQAFNELPWLFEKIRRFETVCARQTASLPEQASAEKDFFARRNITSFINVPMVHAGVLIGMLSFECIQEAENLEDMSVLLKVVAEIFANALEHKQRENILRSSEIRFRELADLLPETVFEIDTKGNFLFINRNAFTIFDCTIDDVYRGFNFFELLAPVHREYARTVIADIIDGKKDTGHEYAALRRGGYVFPVFIRCNTIVRDGSVTGLRGFILDITERKHAEEILAAEKERLAVTLRALDEAVITTDVHGRVVLLNKAAENLTGFISSDAVGKQFDEIMLLISEKTGEPCEDPIGKVLRDGRLSNPPGYTIVESQGVRRTVLYSGVLVRDRESSIIGVVLVVRDITEKRKMEEEVARAQKIESIGLLAGGIAHDFNNILTAIVSNITLAKMMFKPEDEPYQDLAEAEKAAFRARTLTQQLLTFSKGGAPVKKAASIVEILRESAEFALRGSNVKCEFSIVGDIWPVEVDVGQISQVVNNLVINAQEAMPAGGTISIQAENIIIGESDHLPIKDGRYIKIVVHDQGVGVPPEYADRIFEPYFTTKQRGSGLGLAIVYSIIKRHNGLIVLEPSSGPGTSFCIYMPASLESRIAARDDSGAIIKGSGRVLLMDDEAMILQAISRALSQLGYTVECVYNGEEAIKAYRQAYQAERAFDVVIMDLTIPGGMGGKEAIKILQGIDPQVKALVSSGYSNDPVMANFKDYGFSGVIIKPYRIEDLSKAVHDVMSAT